MNIFRKKFLKKLLLTICAVILLLLAGTALAAVYKYNQLSKSVVSAVVLQEPQILTPGEIPLGERYTCRTIFKAPWNMTPQDLNITAGEGIQLVQEPVFERTGASWGWTKWVLALELQPYRSGNEIGKGGMIQLAFATSEKKDSQLFELPIPTVKVSDAELPEKPGQLELAETLNLPKKLSPAAAIFAALAGLLLIVTVILVLVRVFRRSKTFLKVKTVWEIALDAIHSLREEVTALHCSPENAVASLTDIIRHFIEQRFSLRAERQTTVEFLHELEKADSPLPDADRRFLRDFMASADMIKFARVAADRQLFENAAIRAEQLVNGSRPQTEEKEVPHA